MLKRLGAWNPSLRGDFFAQRTGGDYREGGGTF